MAAKVKKGKKKGTTMALTDFLCDETGSQGPGTSYVLANKSMDWAAEMEELDVDSDPTYPSAPAIDRAKLPTAPKASRGPEDLSKVPTEPPFTAFIGNLPYEATEEKITEFFRKLPVMNVRLPEDNGRLRGFGYVQFESRDALIEALSMSEEQFGGRKVRIDLAGESQGDNRKGGGRRDDGQPDRTEGDWRRTEARPESNFNDRGPRNSYDDRTPSRDDRGPSRYDDRGPSRYDDRRDDRGFGDRGSRFDDRGGRFDDRREGRGFDDRGGFGRRDDRGGFGRDRYDDRRDDRRDDRYGGGGRDRYDDRDGGRRNFGSGFRRDDRDERGGDDRSWERGGGGNAYRGDRGGDRGYGGDRGGDREDRYGRPERTEREAETPKERPRLQLQPRSRPVENTPDIKPQIDSTTKVQEKPKSSSIFGSAKPVDTAQREREIEEKLLKQKDVPPPKTSVESRYGSSKGYDEPSRDRTYNPENKENKNVSGSRRRSGSERSEEGDARRERRSSGSSKAKKGSTSSHGRSRQDSGEQSHGEVFSGGEDDKSHNAVTPGHTDESVKLVPAPLPKENIWEKRKSSQSAQSPPQRTEAGKPPAQESRQTDSSVEQHSKSSPSKRERNQSSKSNRTSSQSSTDSTPSKNDGKKDFVPAEPPKENPWTKRKIEREQQVPSKRDGPAPVTTPQAVPSAWAGRGGGDRGRGRGGGFGRGRGEPAKHKEKREKPLPQSIDEMPKYEEKKNKDFSDNNKFAGLMDDDDDDNGQDSS